MKAIFSVPLKEDINFYLLFYLFSFSIAFLIIFYRCIKSKEDHVFLCTLTAAIFLGFVFGCKTITVLEGIATGNSIHAFNHTAQMGLGGVIFSFLVVVLLRSFYDIPGKYLYAVGLALLIGLMLEKPGCLVAGCCRGSMAGSNLLSVSYPDAVLRHPLQLYEMGLYLLAIVVLIKTRVKVLATKYFLAVVLFCLVQVVAEFLKEPIDTIAFANEFLGVKMLQWIYMLLATLSFINAYLIETNKRLNLVLFDKRNILSSIILLLTVVSVFAIIHPFLFKAEIFAINLALIPSVFVSTIGLFNHFSIPRYRWASILIMILPLFLMSQTLPDLDDQKKVFKTIGIGYHGGKFNNIIINDTDPGSCGGIVNSAEFTQKYSLFTVGYSKTYLGSKDKLAYGINLSFGGIEESNFERNTSEKHVIVSANPFIMHDMNWFGIGGGLHIGSNRYAMTKAVHREHGTPETGLGSSPFYPQAYLRVGPKRYLALEYNFANHFPGALPAFTHEMAIGSGLGFKNGLYFKYGTLFGSQSHYENGNYASAYIPIENTIVLEPLIGFGTMNNVYMIGLSYRFAQKESE